MNVPEFREYSGDEKYEPVTASDLTKNPEQEFLDVISHQAAKLAISPANFRVLDFGCGRGTTVGRLRNAGWDAFGVDVEPQFIKAGALVSTLGPADFQILSLLDTAGRSVFPDSYFDAVISDQLLEHVASLDQITRETSRLLKPGGVTFHRFPARLRPVEPHYKLPFVHWLPKNKFRQAAIKAMLAVGLPVPIAKNLSRTTKAQIIFSYSCQHTFYRRRREIELSFLEAQIPLDFDSMWTRLCERRLCKLGLPSPLAAGLANVPGVAFVLNTFHGHRAVGHKMTGPDAK